MSKIVFVHLYNDMSGSPKILSNVVRAFKATDHQLEMITSSHSQGFLSGQGIKTRHCFYKRSSNKLLTLLYYIICQIDIFIICLRYRKEVDCVFYINTLMPSGAALASKLCKAKVIYHIHETSITPDIFKRYLRWVVEISAGKVVFVSDYLAMKERFSKKTAIVIHNPIEAVDSEVGRRSKNGLFSVLMICSLKKYKGVHEFLQLARMLECNSNIQFTLVLNAGRSEIDVFFGSEILPGNIEIFSRQSDVSGFYKRSDILLNLSLPDQWIETFGMTVLEAFSFGLPVIVPVVGGPAEVVRDSVDGFLIDSRDTEKIKNIIIQLYGNHDLYNTISLNAYTRSQDFGVEKFDSKIVQLI